MAGLFCVLEGIDGSGKSTLLERLKILLPESLLPFPELFFNKEPTDGPFGQKIKSQLQNQPDAPEWLELFMQDRQWNLETRLRPALLRGALIVQDRYFYSTAAYQSVHSTRSAASILEESRSRFPDPDLLFFLEIDPQESARRVAERRAPDGFESNRSFLNEVAANYQKILPDSAIRLDASKPVEVTAGVILKAIRTAEE